MNYKPAAPLLVACPVMAETPGWATPQVPKGFVPNDATPHLVAAATCWMAGDQAGTERVLIELAARMPLESLFALFGMFMGALAVIEINEVRSAEDFIKEVGLRIAQRREGA